MSLFKEALSDALKSTSMTAVALAEKTKVHRSRISDFVSGGSLPKDDTIVAICKAFSEPIARNLAQAWVRERLGPDLSDAILANETISGTEIERLYNALPASTARAFLILMRTARNGEDLRNSLESLASFIAPADAAEPEEAPNPRFKVTKIIGKEVLEPTPEQKKASSVNETPDAAPELASNRLRRKLADVTKGGTGTR